MVKPKTYNEFMAWFYLQRLMQYYKIEEKDAEVILEELKNGSTARGTEAGFEIVDGNGIGKYRYKIGCDVEDIAYIIASNSNFVVKKVQPAPAQVSRSSSGDGYSSSYSSSSYSGGSSNNNNNNNNNNNTNNNNNNN
ncbi:MAG: hypothetical protein IJ198_01145 [Lachnospiraceae bacterium]|nr:hypothetical protein [Lachnospiraceae bacterium]